MSANLVLVLFLSIGGFQIGWGPPRTAAFDPLDYRLTNNEREGLLASEFQILEEEKNEAEERARRPDAQPSFEGVQRFLASSQGTRMCGSAFNLQLAAIRLVQRRGIRRDLRIKTLNRNRQPVDPDIGTDTIASVLGDCPFPPDNAASRAVCDKLPKRFRTFNGVCNNLRRPGQGASFTPFIRALPPDYSDALGINDPRMAASGNDLPLARDVSRFVFPAAPKRSNVFTTYLLFVGQILDHDYTRTALTTLCGDNAEEREVECGLSGCETGSGDMETCFPIFIPDDDEHFPDAECLMFVRNQGVPQRSCDLGPRQQLTVLTHYLDASNVYGSTKSEADALRDPNPKRGKLLTTPNSDPSCRATLPVIEEIDDCVEDQCFTAGDGRVNENAVLSVIHTILLRVHNKVEKHLFRKYGHIWDGERLFQESRRIVGAFWQQFVFNEYLPAILGPKIIEDPRFFLQLKEWGYSKVYDEDVSAELFNQFGAVTFRFSHSMITDIITFNTKTFNKQDSVFTSEILQRPGEVFNNDRPGGCGVDSIAFGAASQQNMIVDRCFTKEVTVRLFSDDPPNKPGSDLVSLNIQRGRDHGIPGWPAWRRFCNLSVPLTFDEVEDIVGKEVADIFRDLYETPADIDLFAGGMTEPPFHGSLLGETFTCLTALQFSNSRRGDRFFFDNGCQKGFFKHTQFTRAQLREIRKVTLARFLCDSLDNIKTIQPWALMLPWDEVHPDIRNSKDPDTVEHYSKLYRNSLNKRVPCFRIPDVDFSVF